MHANTKLTPVIRKEVFRLWNEKQHSLRTIAAMYHVDKRVISRIIERGKVGDFSVHTSLNYRYQKTAEPAERLNATRAPSRGVPLPKR
jgi:hypothetical protein